MQNQTVLLLNASNMETFPVYPYAFIQVSAVARQVGIKVVCKDLLGIPQENWKQTIQALIEQHNPGMLLITLRTTDSLDVKEYTRDSSKEDGHSAYFPIQRTRDLISTIRKISNLKIVVGGFAFSLLPEELMNLLQPDFGVCEGPDDFFAMFNQIHNGDPSGVANLLFFQDGRLISNPRTLYPPFAGAEYNSHVIKEMMNFYGSFPTPGFQGAPVEIMRGCNHSCVFCAEPHSKGAKVRYRDLGAIMRDIEILVQQGINRLYLISSELNPEGNEFILELAERIRFFNISLPGNRKITWFGANYLLKFQADEFSRLCRSGFTGGWFDITSLDDENAHLMRTPYSNKSLITHLKTYAQHQMIQIDLLQQQKASGVYVGSRAGDGREEEFIRWSMFLGNPATTIETIRNTLKIANQEGLSTLFDQCGIEEVTRVFNYEEPSEATLVATYSVAPGMQRVNYQQVLPSFAYPPALLEHFSEAEISEMFSYIAETYLSKKYQQTRDWIGFINQRATASSITYWLAEIAEIMETHVPVQLEHHKGNLTKFQKLFPAEAHEGDIRLDEFQSKQIVDMLVSTCLKLFPDFFKSLGLPDTTEQLEKTNPYELAVAIFSRWEHPGLLQAQIQPVSPEWKRDLLLFCIQAILYRFNILFKSCYKSLFISQ